MGGYSGVVRDYPGLLALAPPREGSDSPGKTVTSHVNENRKGEWRGCVELEAPGRGYLIPQAPNVRLATECGGGCFVERNGPGVSWQSTDEPVQGAGVKKDKGRGERWTDTGPGVGRALCGGTQAMPQRDVTPVHTDTHREREIETLLAPDRERESRRGKSRCTRTHTHTRREQE